MRTDTTKSTYRLIEIILLIFMFLQFLSIGYTPLEDILVNSNAYIGLIYAFFLILIELRIRELQFLPSSISQELSKDVSNEVVERIREIPGLKPLNKNEFYFVISEMLDKNQQLRMISNERPIETDYIKKTINQLNLRKNELTMERVNRFDLDNLVWLTELAMITEKNENIKYYIMEYPPIGIFVGKGGDFDRAIIVWGSIKAIGPSSALYMEGKTLSGKKIIDDLWEYAGETIDSSILIKSVEDLRIYINNKITKKDAIVESIDKDRIKRDMTKINEMDKEHIDMVKFDLKKIIDKNKVLKNKLFDLKF